MEQVHDGSIVSGGAQRLETATGVEERHRKSSSAEEMKAIKRQRLRRMVFQDPTLARELVKTEASAVYNARGEIIAAVSSGASLDV